MQSLVSPLSSRILLPQVGKTSESVDGGESGEGGGVTGRVFSSPSGVPGIQWRPGIGNPFQSQHEGVCFTLFCPYVIAMPNMMESMWEWNGSFHWK